MSLSSGSARDELKDEWRKKHEDIFNKYEVDTKTVSVNPCTQWKEAIVPREFTSQTLEFTKVPPLNIEHTMLNLPSVEFGVCNRELFKSEAGLIEGLPTKLDEIIAATPPLISIKPNQTAVQISNGMEYAPPGSYQTIVARFCGLTAPENVPILEPIVASCFIWDGQLKRRCSDVWSYCPTEVKGLCIEQKYESSSSARFEVPHTKGNMHFVVVLQRLVLKRKVMESYYKHNNNADHVNKVVGACWLPYVLVPFAWTRLAYNELKIGDGEPACCFTNFIPGCDASDAFLSQFTAKEKDKKLAFVAEICFENGPDEFLDGQYGMTATTKPVCALPPMTQSSTVDETAVRPLEKRKNIDSNVRKPMTRVFSSSVSQEVTATVKAKVPERALPRRTDATLMIDRGLGRPPHMFFRHEIVVRLGKAKFKFAKALAKDLKVVYGQVTCGCMVNNVLDNVKCFDGSATYMTRAYEGFNVNWQEDIVITINREMMDNAAMLTFTFKVVCSSPSKRKMEEIGRCTLPLFPDGSIISDGVHEMRFSEMSSLSVEVNVRSVVMTSNPGVESILEGNLKKFREIQKTGLKNKEKIDIRDVLPHLYGVLDKIIEGIRNGNMDGYSSLVAILNTFPDVKDKESYECKFLAYYLKYGALRRKEDADFVRAYVTAWHSFQEVDTSDDEAKYCGLAGSWFTMALLIKGLTVSPDFKEFGHIISLMKMVSQSIETVPELGQKYISEALAGFCKTMFEFDQLSTMEVVYNHVYLLNQRLFVDFMKVFLTPRIFIMMLAPRKNRKCLFDEIFLHKMRVCIRTGSDVSDVFWIVNNILMHFGRKENMVIAPLLMGLFTTIAECCEFKSRGLNVDPLMTAHYILYYGGITVMSQVFVEYCTKVVHLVRPIENEEWVQFVTSTNVAKRIDSSVFGGKNSRRVAESSDGQHTMRQFSLDMRHNANMNAVDYDGMRESMSALALCIHSVLLKLVCTIDSLNAFNLLVVLWTDNCPALLHNECVKVIEKFINEKSTVVFLPESNLYRIVKRLMRNLNSAVVQLIPMIMQADKRMNAKGSTRRSRILIVRALGMTTITKELVMLMKAVPCEDLADLVVLAEKLYQVNQDLLPYENSHEVNGTDNDIACNYYLEKAELLMESPDARLKALINLGNYQTRMCGRCMEVIITRLVAAGLVSEGLSRLGVIDCSRYGAAGGSFIDKFIEVCPAAKMGRIPDNIAKDPPNIRGYCTGRNFSEYGLVDLIMKASEACKRAQVYVFVNRIYSSLSHICKYRGWWSAIAKHLVDSEWALRAAEQVMGDELHKLAMSPVYYFVEFQEHGQWIYRESKPDGRLVVDFMRQKIVKWAANYANGREVVVYNNGNEMKPREEGKYFVFVKNVTVHMTSEEKAERLTAFDRNYDVNKFYFAVPKANEMKDDPARCYQDLFIITVENCLPHVVNRAKVAKVEKGVVSPLRHACNEILAMTNEMEEAIERKSLQTISMNLIGKYMTSVNAGMMLYPRTFLTHGGVDTENVEEQVQLRRLLGVWLDVGTRAVELYGASSDVDSVRVTCTQVKSFIDGVRWEVEYFRNSPSCCLSKWGS